MELDKIAHLYQELWANPEAKQAFLSNPRGFLEGKGFAFESNAKIVAHEDTETVVHFVIPDPSTKVSKEAGESSFLAQLVLYPELREQLKKDPKGVLAKAGITYPEGAEIVVLENSAEVQHIVLPPKPSEELSDLELEAIAGGVSFSKIVTVVQGAATAGCGAAALLAGAGVVASPAALAGLELVKSIAD